MMNYKIWYADFDGNEILVEIFNSVDVWSIQKEFIEKGYIIEECFDTLSSSFFKAYKHKESH